MKGYVLAPLNRIEKTDFITIISASQTEDTLIVC